MMSFSTFLALNESRPIPLVGLNIVKYSVDELNFNHRSLKKPRVAEEFLEDEQTEES
jgi:hypothetical protein